MRCIDLGYRTVSKDEVKMMNLNELNELMCEVQELIHATAAEKNRTTTLPKKKKDGKTLVKARKLTEKLMFLQDSVNYISAIKKQKRDTMQLERDWLKSFMDQAKVELRKSLFDKLIEQTNLQCGYPKP